MMRRAGVRASNREVGDIAMKRFVAGLAVFSAVLAVSAGAANAAEPAPAPERIIERPNDLMPNFDWVNFRDVLAGLNIVAQERKLSDGSPFIAASIGAELSFMIVPLACRGANHTDCSGANIITFFTGGYANPQSVSAFNQKYPFTSAGMLSDNSGAFLSRYEIADFGIPRGNVQASLESYFAIAQRFRREITARTVSADGYADDMSASILNVRSGEAIGVDARVADDGSLGAVHEAGFEATPELVKKLLAAQNAPRNKIGNITK